MRKGKVGSKVALSLLGLSLLLGACGQQVTSSAPSVSDEALSVSVNRLGETRFSNSQVIALLDVSGFRAQSVDNADGVSQVSEADVANFRALAASVAAQHNLEIESASVPSVGLALFRVKAGSNVQEASRALASDPRVKAASLNYLDKAYQASGVQTNDTYSSRLWGMRMIGAQQAWREVSPNIGSRALVAVIDSGIGGPVGDRYVQDNHPDLAPNMQAGFDFVNRLDLTDFGFTYAPGLLARFPALRYLDADVDPGPDPYPIEEYETADATAQYDIPGIVYTGVSHGQHVSGTIAAVGNNNRGVIGVAPNANIMMLRALGTIGGTTFDILNAVLYAAGEPVDTDDDGRLDAFPRRRADVVNMSLGGFRQGDVSPLEDAVYNYVVNQRNVVVVAAAGNESTSRPSYPASSPAVISVSSVDVAKSTGQPLFTDFFSNFGPTVDISAPGGICWKTPANWAAGVLALSAVCDGRNETGGLNEYLILSTTHNPFTGDGSVRVDTPGFSLKGGTSMSSPHVAGVAALVRAVNPALNSRQVRQILLASATDITSDPLGYAKVGRDDFYGAGVVNAPAAVRLARNTTPVR